MTDGSFGAVFAQSGLSLEQAEEELGVSTRQIRRYVSGEAKAPKLARERVEEIAGTRLAARPPERFRFIDLFAGIGGLRLGFEAIGGRCVFTSEWDRALPQGRLGSAGRAEGNPPAAAHAHRMCPAHGVRAR